MSNQQLHKVKTYLYTGQPISNNVGSKQRRKQNAIATLKPGTEVQIADEVSQFPHTKYVKPVGESDWMRGIEVSKDKLEVIGGASVQTVSVEAEEIREGLDGLQLSEVESIELSQAEQTIEIGLRAFWEAGKALLTIRDKKLYRADYETFENYCESRWRMDRTHAYRLIAASKVLKNLSPVGDNSPLPSSERQIRPLAKLKEPSLQQKAWENAVQAAGGSSPTAKQVASTVEELLRAESPEPENQTVFNSQPEGNNRQFPALETEKDIEIRNLREELRTLQSAYDQLQIAYADLEKKLKESSSEPEPEIFNENSSQEEPGQLSITEFTSISNDVAYGYEIQEDKQQIIVGYAGFRTRKQVETKATELKLELRDKAPMQPEETPSQL
jgi:hypothetical protein